MARNHLARINEDGSLDTTFDPSASIYINDIVKDPLSPSIIIGGVLGLVNGVSRNGAAKIGIAPSICG